MRMTLEEFRQLSPEQQRETLIDMRRQVQEKLESSFKEALAHRQLEADLVPQINFKKSAPATPTYPEAPPLREGLDQEQFVRQVFRADGSIKEIRCADGSIYQRR